jgi:hypothetical protein
MQRHFGNTQIQIMLKRGGKKKKGLSGLFKSLFSKKGKKQDKSEDTSDFDNAMSSLEEDETDIVGSEATEDDFDIAGSEATEDEQGQNPPLVVQPIT